MTDVLTVTGLSKQYDGSGFTVADVALSVREGELLTLLGPSGCGKTTTLRSIAGLETPDTGRIELRSTPLFDAEAGIDVPAERRGLAMVFQSYAIWPHLSVARNVSFPLDVAPRRERLGRTEITSRTDEALGLVGLAGFGARPATSLSGGQQQRLALARALVARPGLLLLDEPLSNLDAKLREEMRFELKRLQQGQGLAAVYVTHDQEEALAMSTRVAVMHEGRVVQLGTPEEIYERPANEFVATFVGTSNLVRGTVSVRQGPLVRIEGEHLDVWAESPHGGVGDRVVATFRPEDVDLTARSGAPNAWAGEILSRAYLGGAADQLVRTGTVDVRARSSAQSPTRPGDIVTISVAPDRVRLLPG